MPEYIDTHCHLDLHAFDQDRAAVIQRAVDAGVSTLINPSIDVAGSEHVVKMSEEYPRVYAAVGIHPNDLPDDLTSACSSISALAQHPKVVAIGEIGLDLYHKDHAIEDQITAFQSQLQIAFDLDHPVIVHSREALAQTEAILIPWCSKRNSLNHKKPYGVMHSFEGTLKDAMRFIEIGFMISLAGPVTYKNATAKHELAAGLPSDSLVLETDSPFLTPIPFRGQRNEPSYLPQIAERTAIIRKCDVESIAEITSNNARKLFNIGEQH